MIHIIYISQAVCPLSDPDLEQLLQQCRRDNAHQQVTGILFYSHGKIAQLMEGEAHVLEPLFEKIARDGRHSQVTRLVSKPIRARSFADWAMAFHPLEPAGFDVLEGFLRPAHLPPFPDSLPIADSLLVELVRLAVFGPPAGSPSAAPPR